MELGLIETEMQMMMQLPNHPSQWCVRQPTVTVVLCRMAVVSNEPSLFEDLTVGPSGLLGDLFPICCSDFVPSDGMPEVADVYIEMCQMVA